MKIGHGGTLDPLATGVLVLCMGNCLKVVDLITSSVRKCKEQGYVNKGDLAVVTSGIPLGKSGTTNMIKVEIVD